MRSWPQRITRGVERVLGRRNLVRISRLLLDHARRDVPNRMQSNGERLVQRVIARGRSRLTVFDVGANVGGWSEQLLETCRTAGVTGGELHLFEPARATFEELAQRMSHTHPLTATINRCALSDATGRTMLYKAHELAGSNSLYDIGPTPTGGFATEFVELDTIDDYCSRHGVVFIDLLKIDAEGHDLLIVQGAEGMLQGSHIGVVQFEYNFRWIAARRFLRDAMIFFGQFDYVVGKVTPDGIEWYPRWDPELETFKEANYIASLPSLVDDFPALTWWKRA